MNEAMKVFTRLALWRIAWLATLYLKIQAWISTCTGGKQDGHYLFFHYALTEELSFVR